MRCPDSRHRSPESRRTPGGWVWLEATSRAVRGAAGALYLLAAAEMANLLDADGGRVVRHIDDSTAEAVANADARARLTVQATTDALTGLADHGAFHSALAEEFARTARYDGPSASRSSTSTSSRP